MPLPPLTVAAAAPVEWRQWAMIAGGALLLGYLVLRPMLGGRGGLLGGLSGGRRDPLARPPGQLDPHRLRSTERQLESLLVELEQMSRAISGQLDTRSARLEAQLAEANATIAALDAKLAEARAAPGVGRLDGRDGRDGRGGRGAADDSIDFRPMRLATRRPSDYADPADDPLPGGPFALRPFDARPVEPPGREESNLLPAPPRVDPSTEAIYARADAGESPAAIAHDLGRPSGEVELILALRPR